jgi:ParB family transcriptional regulator, chromosome partitioning protein
MIGAGEPAMARAGKASEKNKGRRRTKKKTAEAGSRGLAARDLGSGSLPSKTVALRQAIESDGGSVLGVYRDPVGGNWQLLAGLPLEKVQATPFQRDLSETHVGRLAGVVDRLDRFLDPIIVVRREEGTYWTPNGHHRTAALRRLGARSIVALVVPEEQVAYRILALNTEKAHNLREKSLEVIRMARALAELDPRPEKDFVLEFEEPAYLTLGMCYEKKGRFSGGAYHPALKRVDAFLEQPLPQAVQTREKRAAQLLELDETVSAAVLGLKERGLDSPYLKAFVVARINPLRFHKGPPPPYDETISRMLSAARKFDASKVKAAQLAAASGPPEE